MNSNFAINDTINLHRLKRYYVMQNINIVSLIMQESGNDNKKKTVEMKNKRTLKKIL